MYQQFFGLNEQPFSIAVNPRYLFMSARHRDALAHLLYGVGSGGGFILLTGEVGTGKTTLNRCLLEQMPEQTDIAIVLNPALSAVELLATVCDEFEIEYPAGTDSLKVLTDSLHQFLLSNHRADRRTVLMIDEAQHLGVDVLEQIRLLTNLETDEKKLLQIILTGQPELASMLSRPELRQLNQRITARFDLTPLDRAETRTYVQHRLNIAGNRDDRAIFSVSALREIYRLSGGVPRLINLLCDRAMMGAYGRQQDRISAGLIREAASEVLGSAPAGHGRTGRGGRWGWILAVVVTFCGLAAFITGSRYFELADHTELAVSQPQGNAEVVATPTPAENGSLKPHSASDDESSRPWLLKVEEAESALWQLWSGQTLQVPLCQAAVGNGLQCERLSADTWDEVIKPNRPAILALKRENGFAAATVLLSVSDAGATLWTGRAVCNASLTALASAWRGQALYLWQAPEDWIGPVGEGDSGSVVSEIVDAFAELDNLPAPPLDTYTPALAERVREFQRLAGLEGDGVLDAQTWQVLSDRLGRGFTLKKATRLASSNSGGAECR